MVEENKNVIRNQIYKFKDIEEMGFIDTQKREFGYMLYKRGRERLGLRKIDEENCLVYLKYMSV